MKDLEVIPATTMLLRAHFNRLAGRVTQAKMKVEKIQARYPKMFEFLDAYYGFLLITERNIEGASKFFESNMESLPNNKNDNQRYIELYCRYFLEASQNGFDWQSLISEAHELKPDALTKRLLVLPTRNQIISSIGD